MTTLKLIHNKFHFSLRDIGMSRVLTREQLKQNGEAMIAHSQDKPVQVRAIEALSTEDEWRDCGQKPLWYFDDYEYRPKPTPTYRPFNEKETEALIGEIVRYKLNSLVQMVIATSKDRLWVGGTASPFDTSFLLSNYTFLDGSACGVEVEPPKQQAVPWQA